MTALGILNRIIRRFGVVLQHQVEMDAPWRPWWHGHHVKGTWRLDDAERWFR